tara:strand:+ start:2610 stop:3443 length:834 start_codon:yes stop_codon:yes gene_type:complete
MSRKKVKLITLGADPEVFVSENGELTPCIGYFEGTKDEPTIYEINGTEIGVQEDNVMFEFNTKPADSKEAFIEIMRNTLTGCRSLLDDKGLSMEIQSSATFSEQALEHPQAQKSGCDPDENAWEEMMCDPVDLSTIRERCAGGHVHLGIKVEGEGQFPDPSIRSELVKLLDVHVGLEDVIRNPDRVRKELYGAAGSFRFKPYGLEYRSPSNYWIASDELVGKMWDNVEKAIKAYNNNFEITEEFGNQVVQAINTCNVEVCTHLLLTLNKKKEYASKL